MSETLEIKTELTYEADSTQLDEVVQKLKQIEELLVSISKIGIDIKVNVRNT